jgi:hypothetical protein
MGTVQALLLETDSDEASSYDSNEDNNIDTDTNSDREHDMQAKFTFGQDHRKLGILVVSNLTHTVPVD